MSSGNARRLTCFKSFPALLRRQALLHIERTARAFSAQAVGGNGEQDKTCEPADPHRSHENPNFKSYRTAPLRSPETSALGKLGTRSRVGISGPGYGRQEAAAANGGVSLDSTNPDRTGGVLAMRNAYNNAQEDHFEYGTNAATNPQTMVLPRERDTTRTATNQKPSKNYFGAINQRQEDGILEQQNSTSLAQEYHVCKMRTHATLWQQELRKQAGEENADSTMNGKDTFGVDVNKTVPQDWESFDPPGGEFYDESLAKEEALMFEEFEKRRERNRIQIASFVKQHLYGRRRPVDGWKYIIDNFGADDKAAKGSAFGSRKTTGNDLEKLALKRESGQLRKKA